jgi:hypothetical protein
LKNKCATSAVATKSMTVKTTEGQASGSSKKTNEALHPLRLACVSARVKGGDFYCWGCAVDFPFFSFVFFYFLSYWMV